MSKVYVLMMEQWGGTDYQTEVVEVFKDEEVAGHVMIQRQGSLRACDVRYYVVDAEFNDFEP